MDLDRPVKLSLGNVEARNPSQRDLITTLLNNAIQSLATAVTAAHGASPLTASIPVFQRMTEMQKEISGMMLEVNKIRGL